MAETRKSILEAAEKCVCEGEEQYGPPEDNFQLIADLWVPYIKAKCVPIGADVDMLPDDVAMLMALLKIARIASGQAKADNYIDLAGYAACAGEVAFRANKGGV